MSTNIVTALALAGVLVASPVAAQRQRNPGNGGGGQARVGQSQGGRSSAGRSTAGRPTAGRPTAGRQAQPARPYAAPPAVSRQSPPSAAGRRYNGPGGPATATRNYGRPPAGAGVVGPARVVPRANQPGAYANRAYPARPGAPVYGVRPGYAVPRPYAPPRAYGPSRAYGPGYVAPRYYGSRPYASRYIGHPRYVAPGWRGPWGYAVLTPRFVYPTVISVGYWRPYYYRPSIGIGLYYGADGLYPFGAVAPGYYNPAPDVTLGGVRIIDAPRDAQVFADGNYVGIVDDFDGAFQHLNIEPGVHRIEIHAPGLVPIAFDVDVPPGQTITLSAEIQ